MFACVTGITLQEGIGGSKSCTTHSEVSQKCPSF